MKGFAMYRSALTAALLVALACPAVVGQQTPPVQPKIQDAPLPPAVALPPPPSTPADLPNRPLTAEEAALIALHRQPDIRAAQGSVYSAQGRHEQARSGLFPTLTTAGSYTNVAFAPVSTVPGAGTTTGFQVQANLRQLVFDFNHTRDVVAQAHALELASGANLTRVQSDTVLQVKQAFYSYAQSQRLVAVNEANLRNAQSQLALAQARLNVGLGLPSDVVRAQTAVANAVFNLTAARNTSSVARVSLAEIMGIDPRTPVETADTSEPAPPADDANALIAEGLKRRPEMAQANLNVAAARYGVSAAKTVNAPAITANAGLLQRGKTLTIDDNTIFYGVGIEWTPFDAGFTAGRVEEARGNLITAQAQLESTRLAVTSDVSQAWLNLKTAEQRAATAEAEVANATEAVRLTEGRYKSGLGTFLDVIDAQTALVTADTNRVNSLSAVNQARAALAHAIGQPCAPRDPKARRSEPQR